MCVWCLLIQERYFFVIYVVDVIDNFDFIIVFYFFEYGVVFLDLCYGMLYVVFVDFMDKGFVF